MTEDIWKLARDWTLCASRDGIERSANLAAALNLAAIAEELRRSNEDRDRFYREVLGVLTSAKDSDGSLRSGQPAAAPDGQESNEPRVCRACGKQGVLVICTEEDGPLTRKQWIAHHGHFYDESREYGANKTGAVAYADRETEKSFGPCPEES